MISSLVGFIFRHFKRLTGRWSLADEDRALEGVICGERPVATLDERMILKFLGGIRAKPWPEKFVRCRQCGVEWRTRAYPNRLGTWWWASICNYCADKTDAYHCGKRKDPRNVHNLPYKEEDE